MLMPITGRGRLTAAAVAMSLYLLVHARTHSAWPDWNYDNCQVGLGPSTLTLLAVATALFAIWTARSTATGAILVLLAAFALALTILLAADGRHQCDRNGCQTCDSYEWLMFVVFGLNALIALFSLAARAVTLVANRFVRNGDAA